MSRSALCRSLPLGALALSVAIAGGCQSSPPVTVVTSAAETPVANPGTPASANAIAIAGLSGSADINGVPLAGADVKIFRPGQTEPIAIGKTGPDGRFSVSLGQVIAAGGGNVIAPGGGNVIAPGGGNVIAPGGGNVIAPGGGNVIAAGGGNVIAAGGGNVIAAGGGNVIAPGGGNVIAPGGGNLLALGAPLKVVASKDGAALAGIATAGVIAAGGGNVIAAGGGNVIAAGGGNVIAAGGGNYRVRATSDIHLDAATTLAVIALGDRLDAALRAVQTSDGRVVTTALEAVLSAYTRLTDTVAKSLGGENAGSLVETVTRALDANGDGVLSATAQTQIVGAIADFKTTFSQSARDLGVAIQTATSSGGDASGDTSGVSFGGVSAPAVGTTSGTTSSGSHGGSASGPLAVSVNGQLVPASVLTASPVPVRATEKSFSTLNGGGSTVGSIGFLSGQRYGVGLVSYGGAFYEIGGFDSAASNLVSRIALTPLTLNGDSVNMLGTRTDPQTLAMAVYDHGTAVAGGNVYVVGGRNGPSAIAMVQSLPLASLGSATPFVDTAQPLGTARYQHSVSAASSVAATRLYAVGGKSTAGVPLASVERKDVLPTSSGWSDAGATLLTARHAHISVVTTDSTGTPAYLYVIGGRAGTTTLDSVERAAINTDGSLGAFTQPSVSFKQPKTGATLTYPIALTDPTRNDTGAVANNVSRGRFGMQAAVIGRWLYVFGGLRDNGAGQVLMVPWADRAPIDPLTGELGAFTPSPAELLTGRGFYALGLCFSNPADPNTLTDALVFGGTISGTGGTNPYVERSLWR